MDANEVVRSQVVRFYEELWNVPDLSLVPDLLHPDIAFRGSLGDERVGHDQFVGYVTSVITALGDYRCDIVQLVAEPEQVAARMVFSGVHRGRFLGVDPSGVRVSWAGAAFFSFVGELIRDLWVLGDMAGLRAQLDAATRAGN
jgi:predicted ester cyclase